MKRIVLFSMLVLFMNWTNMTALAGPAGGNASGNPVLQQQTRVITGTVVSDKGDPIPGVTVVVKGTTTGTVTDLDGKFNLVIPSNAQTILFSFVGMKPQEFAAAGKNTFDVRLEEDRLALDEVIVIGYGTAKRQEFTGSVSSVKMENSPVALAPNTNALESLKGNVAG
ncbi:MAG TPA: carboxypeptidase-like regulatory domain-containing protein, partial [Prolixibacteraceae bacterium]|nr:carboxypeptidase-like regulatory domain-containing protein [Prolixibacteraceae bacterium]